MPTSHYSRSRAFPGGLTFLLILGLAGCTLRPTKQAATPPPPKPVAAQPPAPEPQLSVFQTAVVLPSPQPINPDAIPAPPPADVPAPEKAEAAPPAPRPARRTAAGPPKPEPEPEVETPAVVAPPVEEQPKIQPILSDEAQRKAKAAIESRRKDIRDLLTRAKAHPSPANQTLVDRINSFVTQSDEAAQRGDYTQANDLSERALILAKGLQVE